MCRYIVGLLAALFLALPAQAAFPPSTVHTCYWSTFNGQGTTYLACAQDVYNKAVAAGAVGAGQCVTFRGFGSAGWFDTCGSGSQVTYGADTTACPANSTLSGGSCSCNSGYAEFGGACAATSEQCPVGQGKTTNRTEGWARSSNPNANDMVSDLGPPSSIYGYNDGACVGNITGTERCWRSQEPSAQGLYRVSCDYTMVVTGPSTTPGESNSDPDEPVASCPGFVGDVNGKTVCVGTASNPVPAGTDAPNAPTSAGNPSAGPKPSTGPGSGSGGSGRTPTTGNGGNNGGPASAAVGPGGSGLRGDLPEFPGEICGAAPLPPCNVKVDETGVPSEASAAGRFSQGNTDVDKVQTDADSAFGQHRDINLPGWSWTFAFPTGCTPLVLAAYDNLEIDVCQWQPVIHDLMSMLWVAAGIFGLIALFRNATGV